MKGKKTCLNNILIRILILFQKIIVTNIYFLFINKSTKSWISLRRKRVIFYPSVSQIPLFLLMVCNDNGNAVPRFHGIEHSFSLQSGVISFQNSSIFHESPPSRSASSLSSSFIIVQSAIDCDKHSLN